MSASTSRPGPDSPVSAPPRRTIAVVSSGLRQPSSTRMLADRLSAATVHALHGHGVATDVQVIELREIAHDLTNMLLTGFAPAALKQALETVTGADGLIAVTPIFSGSYTGLFKNFFDLVDEGALAGMPVLAGATAGTARHSLALEHAVRPLFAYLRAVVVPTAVFGATEDFGRATGSTTTDADPLASRIARGAAELADLVAARAPRAAETPGTAGIALTADFETMLADL